MVQGASLLLRESLTLFAYTVDPTQQSVGGSHLFRSFPPPPPTGLLFIWGSLLLPGVKGNILLLWNTVPSAVYKLVANRTHGGHRPLLPTEADTRRQ